jgi:hypothetical protein
VLLRPTWRSQRCSYSNSGVWKLWPQLFQRHTRLSSAADCTLDDDDPLLAPVDGAGVVLEDEFPAEEEPGAGSWSCDVMSRPRLC